VVLEEGRSVSKNAVALFKSMAQDAATFTGDLVDMVKRFGARALPAGFNKKSYMQARFGRALANR